MSSEMRWLVGLAGVVVAGLVEGRPGLRVAGSELGGIAHAVRVRMAGYEVLPGDMRDGIARDLTERYARQWLYIND